MSRPIWRSGKKKFSDLLEEIYKTRIVERIVLIVPIKSITGSLDIKTANEVFEFTNDGNTIVICGTGTVNTGQQIYQVKLRNPWDLSNAYTFESVSVNPFSLNATNMKYHAGNIWFDGLSPPHPIDAYRTFFRMPLDQYGGFNGNVGVGTDVFNSNIIKGNYTCK